MMNLSIKYFVKLILYFYILFNVVHHGKTIPLEECKTAVKDAFNDLCKNNAIECMKFLIDCGNEKKTIKVNNISNVVLNCERKFNIFTNEESYEYKYANYLKNRYKPYSIPDVETVCRYQADPEACIDRINTVFGFTHNTSKNTKYEILYRGYKKLSKGSKKISKREYFDIKIGDYEYEYISYTTKFCVKPDYFKRNDGTSGSEDLLNIDRWCFNEIYKTNSSQPELLVDNFSNQNASTSSRNNPDLSKINEWYYNEIYNTNSSQSEWLVDNFSNQNASTSSRNNPDDQDLDTNLYLKTGPDDQDLDTNLYLKTGPD